MRKEQAQVSSIFRIFYKEEILRKGESVFFSIWDQDGTNLFLNEPSTNEIPNSGVYYFEFITPATPTYLVVLANDNDKPQGIVLQVGEPSVKKSFYLEGNLQAGASIAYQIYDISSIVLQAGTMTNVAGGFYSVNVEGLLNPFFVEVNQLVGVTE